MKSFIFTHIIQSRDRSWNATPSSSHVLSWWPWKLGWETPQSLVSTLASNPQLQMMLFYFVRRMPLLSASFFRAQGLPKSKRNLSSDVKEVVSSGGLICFRMPVPICHHHESWLNIFDLLPNTKPESRQFPVFFVNTFSEQPFLIHMQFLLM